MRNIFMIICFISMCVTVIMQLLISQPFLYMCLNFFTFLLNALILFCNIYIKDKKNIISWSIACAAWLGNLIMSVIFFINT